MIRTERAVRFAGLALALVASAGGAQQARCTLVEQPTTRINSVEIAPGQRQSYAGGGVIVRCPSRGITLRGDSAEMYPDRYYIVGHVDYQEPRLKVKSNYLNYFMTDERIVAAGDVHATLPSGSTLVGPQAELFRAAPRIRPHEQLRALARPTITIIEKDSSGKPAPPMVVVANTVFMDDSLIYGGGQVTVTRPEVSASGDSVFIDSGKETMRIMRTPRIEGKREKPFTLTGDLIDLFGHNRKLQRVISRGNGVAVSQDMTLRADTIDLHLTLDQLDHAVAWGRQNRARATSPSQNILADSIDVVMPGQRVRTVRAFKKAYAAGKPDTKRMQIQPPDTVDWLAGDAITARFDTVPPKDTTKSPPLRQLVSVGHAQSVYHIAPSDTAERRPTISYVLADTIIVDFDTAQVSVVTAHGSVVGMYLEPAVDSTKSRAPGAPGQKPGGQPPDAKPSIPSVVPLPPRRPPP
jgi:hypothetical protein